MSEYHPSTAAHPELVAGRLSRRRSPTSKLAAGEAPAGLGHHRGREVDPRGVGAAVGQVRRDVSRAGAHLDHRPPVGVGEHPVQQPGLERQAPQLVDQVRRRTQRRRRRTTTAPGRRAPRRRRRSRPPGRRPRVPAAAACSGTGPRRWTQRWSCCPGRRSSSRTSGCGRCAIRRRHASTSSRLGEGVQPLGAGAQLARRLRARGAAAP